MGVGIVPFPRPDSLSADSGKYKILSSAVDSVGLLKGIDEERSRLALEAYTLYKSEFYKNCAGVSSMKEYMDSVSAEKAAEYGIDIFNSEIGDANLRIFTEMSQTPVNDWSESLDLIYSWCGVMGDSIYGANGSPKYAQAIENQKGKIYDKINQINEALQQSEPGTYESQTKQRW